MRAWYAKWKFSFLLAALIGLLVVQSFFEGLPFHQSLFHFLYSLTLLTAILAFAEDRKLRFVLISLGIVAMLATWSVFSGSNNLAIELVLLDRTAGIVFLGLTTGVVLHRVVTATEVTIDTLMGSVCAYLLIAAVWALSYSAIEYAQPGSFTVPEGFANPAAVTSSNINDWLYYSFMTLTTLGYVDIIPQSQAAGTVTWMEAMAGQFYLAILVARLVGLHLVPVSSIEKSAQ